MQTPESSKAKDVYQGYIGDQSQQEIHPESVDIGITEEQSVALEAVSLSRFSIPILYHLPILSPHHSAMTNIIRRGCVEPKMYIAG